MTDTDLIEDIETVEPEGDVTPTEGKAPKAPKAPKIEKGAAWLAAHVSEVTATEVDAKAVRMVLRKLAADGKLEHEAGGRYDFAGPEDPRVVIVVDAFRAKIAKASEPKAPRAARKPKGDADATPASVVEDEDAEVEDLESLDA